MTLAANARRPRAVVLGVTIAVALLAAGWLGGRPGRDGPPLDPRSDAPLGTSALVELLRQSGASIELSTGLPTGAEQVSLVLRDRLDPEQRLELMAWARRGGTLVVADPSSALAPPEADQGSDRADGVIARGDCTISALAEIGDVAGGSPVRFAPADADQVCFASEGRAFVVAHPVGAGHVVAVGGAAFATNALLGRADNAVLAVTLLAPAVGTTVRFVDPPLLTGGGDKTLADLVPIGVKRGLLQLALAFVLYAVWRAIRLGHPVPEGQPVVVAGSALVSAIGHLLERTRAPGPAAERLREGLRKHLRRTLAVPSEAPLATLAEIAAARTGMSIEPVLLALDDRAVTTDAELVAVARAVASLHEEVSR